MRATLRRLRAVLRLFRPLLGGTVRAHDRALRRLGRTLGAARDWDVFLQETLARAEADGLPATARVALRRAAEARRRGAYAILRRRLGAAAPGSAPGNAQGNARRAAPRDGPESAPEPTLGHTHPLAEATTALLAWTAGCTSAPGPLAAPLDQVAPRLLRRLARTVRRRARGLEHADPAALHALRRSVRRLRDAMDALAAVVPVAPDGQRHRRRTRLQRGAPGACRKFADRLGRLNDAGVATVLARRLAGPRGAGAAAAAALSDWAARTERQARRRLPAAWKALRRHPPFAPD